MIEAEDVAVGAFLLGEEGDHSKPEEKVDFNEQAEDEQTDFVLNRPISGIETQTALTHTSDSRMSVQLDQNGFDNQAKDNKSGQMVPTLSKSPSEGSSQLKLKLNIGQANSSTLSKKSPVSNTKMRAILKKVYNQ